MVEPDTFPFDSMPRADCAVVAEHVIMGRAWLEIWPTQPQRIGGAAQVVTIRQADGATGLTTA
jgi:hypothetical protein